MDMIILCVLVYVLLIFLDFVPLYRNKKIKELWFGSIVLLFTFGIHVLTAFDVAVPSPADPIKHMVDFVIKLTKELVKI